MSGSLVWQLRSLPGRLLRAAVSAYNDRRHTTQRLEQLEHALDEERQNAETLRNTVTDLRFQVETLEKTYAKQLTDARERYEAAEAELADRQARLDRLERTNEATAQSLTETRAELGRVEADRNLLREALAASDADEVAAVRQKYSEARYHAGLATIDELMDETGWAPRTAPADAAASPEQDSPAEEMIPPDLVFAGEDDDEGESGT